jgi:heat shock protein HslJ
MKWIACVTSVAVVLGLQTVSLEKTAWRLVTLVGHPPEAVAALKRGITIRFEAGRVTGFSGCNAFNGPYTVDQNRLTFGDLAGTMMACGEPVIARLEDTFRKVLVGRATYRIDGDRLILKTEAGGLLAFEKEVKATLEGAPWTVTAYHNGRQSDVTPLADAALTVAFESGTASGHAGCNTFRAPYTIDEGTLTFGVIATTRRLCPATQMVQEREFLEAIASTERWVIDSSGLQLFRADGERVLTAHRR